MKKNTIAHMVAPSDTRKGFFDKLDLLPRILCLLMALVIWLFVVNIYNDTQNEPPSDTETVETEA